MSGTLHGPDWVCVNPQADWSARDSQGELVFKDHLWILGGWDTPKTPNPRDVWKSPDGKHWTCVIETAPWEHSDIPVALVYKDRMWLMGGRKLPGAENSNKVWSSADGADWTLECEAAGWSPRLSAGHVVFQDKMWVLGGTEDFYHDNDDTLNHDVWITADGKHWTCVTEHAAWSKRAHHQVLVYDDKMWLFGGGARMPDPHPLNDVWCSDDGEHWQQVTDSAPWGPRLWFSSMVYRDRMWILGGWNDKTDNYQDVWCSQDGKQWTQIKSEVIWSARHEQTGLVFQDKVFVAGGHARPTNSEVWSLDVPPDLFQQVGCRSG